MDTFYHPVSLIAGSIAKTPARVQFRPQHKVFLFCCQQCVNDEAGKIRLWLALQFLCVCGDPAILQPLSV